MEDMDIVGRKREIEILEFFLMAKEARFMALYGRRRVGKTFLIEEYFKNNKKSIFLHTTGIKDADLGRQIEEFTKSMSNVFFEGAKLGQAKDWFEVFETLTKAIDKVPKSKKVVLFFDEFPWMATKRSGILQALEYYWNRYWHADKRLRLIICGSAASWIIKKIIKNTGGLYKRITDRIKLEPFSLSEVKEFLKVRGCKLNNKHILKLYMAMGGVPLYLSKVQPGLSADQITDRLCFSKTGFLFDEFEELLAAIFDNAKIYVDIVRAISSQRYGISKSQLIKRLKIQDGGTLTDRLQELEDCGFIMSFIPYTHSSRGQYYKVIDEYTTFYFKWIEPNRNSISKLRNHEGYWIEKSKSSGFQAWSGIAFEAVCFKHVKEIRKNLNLSPSALPYGWRHIPKGKNEDGAQIDLLFDRGDDALTVCEIKYSDKPFIIDKQYAKSLKNKLEIFRKRTKTKKQVFLAMIATEGITPNAYSDEIVTSVLDLNSLFNE